jgi:hypothetical protein
VIVADEPTAAPEIAPTGGSRTMEYLILLAIFALWIILQVWVLPKAGVPT